MCNSEISSRRFDFFSAKLYDHQWPIARGVVPPLAKVAKHGKRARVKAQKNSLRASRSLVRTTLRRAAQHASGVRYDRHLWIGIITTLSHAAQHASGVRYDRHLWTSIMRRAAQHASGVRYDRHLWIGIITTLSHAAQCASGVRYDRHLWTSIITTLRRAAQHDQAFDATAIYGLI